MSVGAVGDVVVQRVALVEQTVSRSCLKTIDMELFSERNNVNTGAYIIAAAVRLQPRC